MCGEGERLLLLFYGVFPFPNCFVWLFTLYCLITSFNLIGFIVLCIILITPFNLISFIVIKMHFFFHHPFLFQSFFKIWYC